MNTKVLVVDDDRLIRTMLVDALDAIGVTNVSEAVDGKEAMLLTDFGEFDLILLDWVMPGMSGLDVLRELRAKGSDVPVILITAQDGRNQVLEAIAAGASDYLVKPFEEEILEGKLLKFCSAPSTSVSTS